MTTKQFINIFYGMLSPQVKLHIHTKGLTIYYDGLSFKNRLAEKGVKKFAGWAGQT
jgi:hypothetical protein